MARYSRAMVYEPAVNFVQAKAFEANLRDFARHFGLVIDIQSRGLLMRTLTVTISGPDKVFIDDWPNHFLSFNLQDPAFRVGLTKHLVEEVEKKTGKSFGLGGPATR